jgi:hypothetical protein
MSILTPRATYAPYKTGIYTYNGVDRVNNKLGYTVGNCVSSCIVCNVAKNDSSLEDFKKWIIRVFNRIAK